MKYHLHIIMLSLLTMISCQGNSVKVLPEAKMEVLMADLILADYTIRQFPVRIRDSVRDELMKTLLEIHNLTQTELDTNVYIYATDYSKQEHIIKRLDARYDSLSKSVEGPPINLMK